ncbi:uncharacterized protein LOC121740558, partial [Aricia agestis]|uniref:uncharacterized protein LOC121740558 n=1 Tax=Aricia agestis TaxID=91739 RepID=UPI001C2086A7
FHRLVFNKMAPTGKKTRGQWSECQLKNAIKAVKRREMSQRAAAEAFCIPRRTLRNHLISGKTEKVTGRPPILNKNHEQDLAKRIIRLAHVGMPLTPKLVRKQAYEFCRANGISNMFSEKTNIAGKKWLKGFLKLKIPVKGQLKQKKSNGKSTGEKNAKKKKKMETETAENEVWFCQACEMDRVADMRQCKVCLAWYHEDCVGLTKEDTDIFICLCVKSLSNIIGLGLFQDHYC